jgi:hypothetical protein
MRGVSMRDDAVALMRSCGTESEASDSISATASPMAVPVEVCMEKPYCIVTLKYSTSEVAVSLLLEAGNVP